MKCPECNFTCSDLRDLCPKCRVDLREFKASLGLPISYPEKTYEELASKLAPNSSTIERKVEPKSLFDTLNDLFQEMKESGPMAEFLDTEVSDDKSEELPIDLGEALPQSSIEQEKQILADSDRENFDLDFDQLIEDTTTLYKDGPPTLEVEPPTEEILSEEEPVYDPAPQQTSIATIEEEEPLEERKEEELPVPPLKAWLTGGALPETSPENTSRAPHSFPSLHLRKISIPAPKKESEELSAKSSPAGIPATNAASNTQSPEPLAPEEPRASGAFREFYEDTPPPYEEAKERAASERPRILNDQAIPELFALSLAETPMYDDDGFEIGASAALPEDTKEAIQLLFHLASESFVDASIEKRFQTEAIRSSSREVTSKAAEEKLKQVEEAMKAPVFSLKDAPTSLSGSEADDSAEYPVHELATVRERVIAWGYDLLFMLGLSIIIALSVSWFEDEPLTELLLQPSSPFFSMAITFFLGNFSTAFLAIFLIYPVLATVSCNRSFGMKFVDCDLFRPDQKKLSFFGNFYTRHLLLPITSILSVIGFFPSFMKGCSIADRLSSARLCSYLRTEEDETPASA